MKKSEQLSELATALSKAQAEFKEAQKDKMNPHYKSDYASLSSIWHASRATLSKHGLSVLQSPSTTDENRLRITTLLMHNSGQFIEDELVLSPKDASPQSFGSATSYGKRYALQSFLGIATDEDDDGEASSFGTPPRLETKHAPSSQEVGDYVIPIGKKWLGRTLKDLYADPRVGEAGLESYVNYLNGEAKKENKPLGGKASEVCEKIHALLAQKHPSPLNSGDFTL